jgi:hypothetical protein
MTITSHRHRAQVIEVEGSGAAVQFSSGRIEFVLHRGLVPPFHVGQRRMVDYVRSINGYEWTFAPFKSDAKHTSDNQCTVDPTTNTCTVCGVEHGAPCPECSGRGFHAAGCTELERP